MEHQPKKKSKRLKNSKCRSKLGVRGGDLLATTLQAVGSVLSDVHGLMKFGPPPLPVKLLENGLPTECVSNMCTFQPA
eukprot:13393-Amphidinium_carterae.1